MGLYEPHHQDIYSDEGQVVATATDNDVALRIALALTACDGIELDTLAQMEPGELCEAYETHCNHNDVFAPAAPQECIGSEGV